MLSTLVIKGIIDPVTSNLLKFENSTTEYYWRTSWQDYWTRHDDWKYLNDWWKDVNHFDHFDHFKLFSYRTGHRNQEHLHHRNRFDNRKNLKTSKENKNKSIIDIDSTTKHYSIIQSVLIFHISTLTIAIFEYEVKMKRTSPIRQKLCKYKFRNGRDFLEHTYVHPHIQHELVWMKNLPLHTQ